MQLGTVYTVDDLTQPGAEPVPGYRLVHWRGRGVTTEVWEAVAPGGFRVALKFHRLPEESDGSEERRTLERIQGLHHPNLLVCFGAWVVRGMLVLAMELADRTLWDRFQEVVRQGGSGIPRDELIEALAEAAKGLDYLGSHGLPGDGPEPIAVAHGAVTPQNILLFGSGVKLADFGLARARREAGGPPVTGFTYAAPETYLQPPIGPSDQYSLAVTYCQLRGGRPPFAGSAAEVMAGHLMASPDLSMLPEEERPVLARALAKDPRERWPSCRALVEALRWSRPAHEPAAPAPAAPPAPLPPPVPGAAPLPSPDPLPPPSSASEFFDEDDPEETSDPSYSSLDLLIQNPAETPDLWSSEEDFEVDLEAVSQDSIPTIPFPLIAASPDQLEPPEGSTAPVPKPPAPLPERAPPAPLPGPYDQPDEWVPPAFRPDRPPRALPTAMGTAAAVILVGGLVLWAMGAFSDPEPGPDPAVVAAARRWVVPPTPPNVPEPETARVGPPERPDPEEDRDEPARPTTAPAPDNESEPTVRHPESSSAESQAAARESSRQPRPDSDGLGTASMTEPVAAVPTLFPPPRPAPVLRLELPVRVTLRAGERTAWPVQIDRRRYDGPVAVDFWGLPRGVTIDPVEIPADSERGEARAAVDLTAKPTDGEVRVVATAGTFETHATVPLTVEPASAATWRREGVARLKAGAVDEAIAAFDAALKQAPEDPALWNDRGIAQLRKGDDRRALADFDAAIERNPNDATAHRHRGLVYRRLGDLDRALADLDAAIRLRPDSAANYNLRGSIHAQRGEFDPALADYREALRRDPDDAAAYNNRALVYRRNGQYDRALADYGAAIQRDPRNAVFRSNRGLAHFDLGDFDAAIADFTRAIELDPGFARAYQDRAMAYARKGDALRAESDRARARRLGAAARTGTPPTRE